MQDNRTFEYAVLRVVPRVEREEFLNVGIIVYARSKKFLQTLYRLNTEKVMALSPTTDINEIRYYLNAFDRICQGHMDGGPIARLDVASRFRWLTATRSTVVQTSKVHTGLCDNPAEILLRLHTQLVL